MNGRLPEPPAGPDPFQHGLPVMDGVAAGGDARVLVRPPRQPHEDGGADLEALWTVFSDAETLRYWSHEPFETREQAAAYLVGIDRVRAGGSLFQWAIAEAATDALVGTVTLYGWDRTHRRAEIGFILGQAHWGKGYASEAVRAVLGFAFDAMGLHRVEADVDPDNAASLALLARLGFREEGRLAERWFTYGQWRDSVVLGLLGPAYSGFQSPSARRSATS